tara:strand:- start:380 stop:664 length:285 start_codon:yes stop_codon:yes gene_type:complete
LLKGEGMVIRKSTTPVSYDDRTTKMKVEDLFVNLVQLIQSREGDIDTIDGTFATVNINELLRLEQEFESLFDVNVEDVKSKVDMRNLVESKLFK